MCWRIQSLFIMDRHLRVSPISSHRATAISVRIDTGIQLVQEIGIVWSRRRGGIGGAGQAGGAGGARKTSGRGMGMTSSNMRVELLTRNGGMMTMNQSLGSGSQRRNTGRARRGGMTGATS